MFSNGAIICGQTAILISVRSTGLRSCMITCHTSFVDCKNATRLFPGYSLAAISFRKHYHVQFVRLPPYLYIYYSQGLECILEDMFYIKYHKRLLCHCIVEPVLPLLLSISGVTTMCKWSKLFYVTFAKILISCKES